MGMNTTQSPETTRGGAIFACIRNDDALMIADDYIGNFASTVDQESDLTMEVMGYLTDIPSELRANDIFWSDLSSVKVFDLAELADLETFGVAEYFFHLRLNIFILGQIFKARVGV